MFYGLKLRTFETAGGSHIAYYIKGY